VLAHLLRILALISTGATEVLEVGARVVFEVGQEQLEKCFVIAFGMNRVRWA
jgi:hypothetical protein